MLFTLFQGFLFLGSGEDFLRVYTIYGHGGHLDWQTATIRIIFCSPSPRKLDMKYGHNVSLRFSHRSIENVNSWDLETKIKGQPLTLTLIYFHVLVNKVCVPNIVHKPSKDLGKVTFQYFPRMNENES